MKLIQLNVWQGRVAEKTVSFIKKHDPDFLCAQEVYSTQCKIPSFYHLDIHEQITKLYPYSSFIKTHDITTAGQPVSYGNAIYSKWPLKDIDSKFTNGRYQKDANIEDYDYNVRVIQVATAQTPHGDIQLFNHHGYHDVDPLGNQQTLASHQSAVDFIKAKMGKSLIISGDFNSSPESPATKIFDTLGISNLVTENSDITSTLGTLSRVEEDVVCDYIMISKNISPRSIVAIDELASDHKALILEFEL